MATGMYFEPQHGGSCRRHAANMLLGSDVYDDRTFGERRAEFHAAFEEAPFEDDATHEDGSTGTTYAVEAADANLVLYPVRALRRVAPDRPATAVMLVEPDGPLEALLAARGGCRVASGDGECLVRGALVASTSHIWAVRCEAGSGATWILDSVRGGPQPARDLATALHEGSFAWLAVTRAGARAVLFPELRLALLRWLDDRELLERDREGDRVSRDPHRWVSWAHATAGAHGLDLSPPPRSPEAARAVVLALLEGLAPILARSFRVLHRVGDPPLVARASTAARALRGAYVDMAADLGAAVCATQRVCVDVLRMLADA